MRETHLLVLQKKEKLFLALSLAAVVLCTVLAFGLDTVVSALSEKSILRIVSNKALLICTKKGPSLETRMYDLPFYLQGSLIYFDLPIAGFEQLEINEEFTF